MQYPIYALLLAAIVTIALGPALIPLLKRLKFGQTERDDGPQSHLKKTGTPTMGGMMFIAGILVEMCIRDRFMTARSSAWGFLFPVRRRTNFCFA